MVLKNFKKNKNNRKYFNQKMNQIKLYNNKV